MSRSQEGGTGGLSIENDRKRSHRILCSPSSGNLKRNTEDSMERWAFTEERDNPSLPEPNEIVRNLRHWRVRHRMTLVRIPMTIHEPLRLVVSYCQSSPRLPKSTSHASREAGGSRKSLESLHAWRRSMDRLWWNFPMCGCHRRSHRDGRGRGGSDNSSSSSGNHGHCGQKGAIRVIDRLWEAHTFIRTWLIMAKGGRHTPEANPMTGARHPYQQPWDPTQEQNKQNNGDWVRQKDWLSPTNAYGASRTPPDGASTLNR